uniref:Uncharacterized protein n=1 Tax=Rhizophora mucronata TaxID=61149 RepID=A0A2P2R2K2_RHIMU
MLLGSYFFLLCHHWLLLKILMKQLHSLWKTQKRLLVLMMFRHHMKY